MGGIKVMKRKSTNKYYFSVEGETEQWYLKWLQDMINDTEKAACKVSIDCPVRKNPLKHAKSLTVTRKIEIYHFFDYESDELLHVKEFQEIMDNMKKAEKIGKQIKYKSGYSNFTFDLWIILIWQNVMRNIPTENSILRRLTGYLEKNFKIWTNSKKRIILRDVLIKWIYPM